MIGALFLAFLFSRSLYQQSLIQHVDDVV